MSNLNTELMTALLKNESIDEVFRSHLEVAMNDLLKIEPETTIITLYKKGITTSEISDLIEKIQASVVRTICCHFYGCHIS